MAPTIILCIKILWELFTRRAFITITARLEGVIKESNHLNLIMWLIINKVGARRGDNAMVIES